MIMRRRSEINVRANKIYGAQWTGGKKKKKGKTQNILSWSELIVCLCNAGFKLNKVCKCHFVSVEGPDDVVTHLSFWYSRGAACQLITKIFSPPAKMLSFSFLPKAMHCWTFPLFGRG